MPSTITSITTAWALVASGVTGIRMFADLDPSNVLLAVGATLPVNDTTAFSFERDEDGMELSGLALQNVYARCTEGINKIRAIPMGSDSATQIPSTDAGAGIVPVKTAAAAANLIAKASAGNLYGFNVKAIAGGTAQQLLLIDSATLPADGAVAPVKAYDVPAAGTLSQAFNPPIRFSAGIQLVLSSTGPYTKTLSAAANFALLSADVK